MTRSPRKRPAKAGAKRFVPAEPQTPVNPADTQIVAAPPRQLTEAAGKFDEVLALIEAARRRAYQAVNAELVGLYWELGQYISKKLESAEWGDGVVDELAATIARQYPGMRGYTRRNLFRMRQFFEAYRGDERVSALLTQLPWSGSRTSVRTSSAPFPTTRGAGR